jgi:hypothetical protein
MAFKLALVAANRYDSIKLEKQKTFTKLFEAGVAPVPDPVPIGIREDEITGETLFVPSDGVAGGGKRVWKTFPVAPAGKWRGSVQFTIFDDRITPEIFERVCKNAGMFVGVGRWRPERNGLYGRFEVTQIDWE